MERLHILVAEDDPDDRMFLEEAFHTIGGDVAVTFAKDGQAALDHLDAHPDEPRRLILADLNMPRMNGFELLERVREQAGLRSTPVVVMSTSAAPDDIQRAYDVGANTYFTKPGRFGELVEKVSTLIGYWGQHAHWPPRRGR